MKSKFKWPSIKNENELTWKCKFFGCKNKELPLTWNEEGERHGIKGSSFATATKTLLTYTFKGCMWCRNFKKIFDEETETWPRWLCDCEICEPNRDVNENK